ncbi:hypothetical protein VNO78_34169 [Psophocarpus tetragonolobus]|uniref:Uncharacterized protein n=1 Tax=Psophocarpus tetragonolobus TaxID=3891 RepID=A0AAN9RS24_PSOTE
MEQMEKGLTNPQSPGIGRGDCKCSGPLSLDEGGRDSDDLSDNHGLKGGSIVEEGMGLETEMGRREETVEVATVMRKVQVKRNMEKRRKRQRQLEEKSVLGDKVCLWRDGWMRMSLVFIL